ncbi:unnamed protein product [Ceratitis capitata]|uniref:(Mediterranean fruit fly) hypothetical protein n=1 Tax=Ceratitis capitata TaxID=7213 RepID=A0A811UX34_CERCA|nr:unnamed protein product [Ceratitis capitata]
MSEDISCSPKKGDVEAVSAQYNQQQELLEYILDTVNKTNMIDYTRIHANPRDAEEELVQRKAEVLATLKQLQNEVAPIMKATDILKNGESMKDSKTFVNALQKDYKLKVEHLESAYKLAKYCMSAVTTKSLRLTSLEDLTRLRDYIDNANFSTIQALQQRTWLIHWSVLVFFNHPKGRDLIIDMFYTNHFTLTPYKTMCPHIMRYLATAVIINRTRRNALKDLIKVIQQESYTYRDPITEFLECLYVNFDFEGARLKLHECQTVILNDFFIVACLNEFVEDARLMIFETFCRIHQCIILACSPIN